MKLFLALVLVACGPIPTAPDPVTDDRELRTEESTRVTIDATELVRVLCLEGPPLKECAAVCEKDPSREWCERYRAAGY